MIARVYVAIGLTAYLGHRGIVRDVRKRLVALNPEQVRLLARQLSNNLTIMTADDETMDLIVRFLKRAREMGVYDPPVKAEEAVTRV